jgi:hypothetical protein
MNRYRHPKMEKNRPEREDEATRIGKVTWGIFSDQKKEAKKCRNPNRKPSPVALPTPTLRREKRNGAMAIHATNPMSNGGKAALARREETIASREIPPRDDNCPPAPTPLSSVEIRYPSPI